MVQSSEGSGTDLAAGVSLDGQEESLGATTVWTFVRLLHSVNGPSTTDDVRRVVGHTGHLGIASVGWL